MLEIYGPLVEATAVTFELAAPTIEEMAKRITESSAIMPWLIADDGTTAGFAYASPHRNRAAYGWSCEVSVYVAEHARRQGLATRLYELLFDLLRIQGYVNAYAGISLPNDASIRLHESLGFDSIGIYRRVGYKHEKWRDVQWFALHLREDPGPAAPPRTVDDMRETPEWVAAFSSAGTQP